MSATGAQAQALLVDPAVATSTPSLPRDIAAPSEGAAKYLPDRVLVRLRSGSSSRIRLQSDGARLGISSLDAVSARVGAVRAVPAIEGAQNSSVAADLALDRWVLIELAPGSNVEAAVAAYGADPSVEVAEPDYLFQPTVVPNDPLHASNWGHNNTKQFRSFNWISQFHNGTRVGTIGFDSNAEAGWTGPDGFGKASVIIAILDTGVDVTHPDLTVVEGYDFGDNDSDPSDDSAIPGHGTLCAGIAAGKANNGLGSCGTAPGCSIMPMKVANNAGAFSLSAVANALVWAADHGADIASMSFGYFTHGGGVLFNAAIDYADAAGVVLFSGTGNNNINLLLYPANHPKVIAVGAASPCGGRKRSAANPIYLWPGVAPDPNDYSCDGERGWGSNFGPATPDAPDAVDILGPTELPTTDIQGTKGFEFGDYVMYFNGVSCSAPYVAGVAALIKSKHPDWTPAQIRQQLLSSARDIVDVEATPGWDRYTGYGMVDLDAAAGCSAGPAIAGKEGITVASGEGCCATIRPTDLVTSVSDPDGDEDIVRVAISGVDGTDVDADSTLVCGLGTHTVRVTVRDYCGNSASVTVDVHVIDATPPSLAVVMDRDTLWPPDHKMVSSCATITAADNCDTDPVVALVSVVSSEPEDGGTVGDIGGADVGTDDHCVDLRSERTEAGIGRWYTLVYSATDASNNVAYDTVTVRVPHDLRAEAMGPNGFAADPTADITALTSIHPNPFNPQTTVHFSLANSERVRLSVYDVSGALVRQLVDETMPSGPHQASWNGKSDRGAGVPSGVYFVRMRAGLFTAVRKIILMM